MLIYRILLIVTFRYSNSDEKKTLNFEVNYNKVVAYKIK